MIEQRSPFALRAGALVLAVVATLYAIICPAGAASPARAMLALPAYAYDAITQTLSPAPSSPALATAAVSAAPGPATTSAHLTLARVNFAAAETAGDVGTAIARSDLAGGQASNFARYSKKLPSGAQEPVITRGANGSVQFSADVPGRAPGSYATYTKVVDSAGTTTDYYKTTVAPDGSSVHVKIKFP